MIGRIVIIAGGTGGHVFPALAVAHEMKMRGWMVSWVGTKKGLESRVVPASQIEMDWIDVDGIRGKGWGQKFRSMIKLLGALRQTWRILQSREPDVVLCMGGFVTGPGGIMARYLGIPVIIHEQNRVPGTTNLLLVKLAARKVLEAFPCSFKPSVRAICTGNPLRQSFRELPEKSAWQPNTRPLRLLILGGSQGAKVLNEQIPRALKGFSTMDIKHQSGQAMQAEVHQHYQEYGIRAEVLAFIEDMVGAYIWADLIICRAGAMTVSEIAACGLPAIFVPLLGAIDDHQTANARYLSETGAALILPQQELNPENIRLSIMQVVSSLEAMSRAAKNKAKLEATITVADICVAEACV
jgi:UDP-N-acetylglucosamine--N-acetylmuramyl-(pentapeptide) pyrophosphoryl-undecaprenol N-acetylglucosamine transferase